MVDLDQKDRQVIKLNGSNGYMVINKSNKYRRDMNILTKQKKCGGYLGSSIILTKKNYGYLQDFIN
jgi:hypothetical protein